MTQFTLDKLTLENFRSYKDKTNINFGPKLTLIFGKGSAGKTTLIDAIQLLHAANQNDVDLQNKSSPAYLTQNSKSKEFSIEITCSEKLKDNVKGIGKSIKKLFTQDKKGFFYPKKITLKAEEGGGDNKFLEILNEPIPPGIEKDRKFKDFYVSKVSFLENKYAFDELFKFTLIHKTGLINNLTECLHFRDQYDALSEKMRAAKKLNKKDEYDKIYNQRAGLFKSNKDEFDFTQFRPYEFPFGNVKVIKNYIKFIEDLKKNEFSKFIQFVSEDTKAVKIYLYKQNKLYSRFDLEREPYFELFEDKLGKIYNARIPSIRSTLLEFLCLSLTDICITQKFDPTDPDSFAPVFPDKDSFQWDVKTSGKTLSPRGMMRVCERTISQTLNQTKTIRHQENIQNIYKNLQSVTGTAAAPTNFYDQIETNIRDINKWINKFEFDFKINVERTGLTGQPTIYHNKGKYKIPSELGGSGAQFLLTYLTAILDSNENTILLEEPEKALHSSLQIKLAEFFTEMTNKNQLVIETHSENLLLGILKQVRDKKIKPHDISVLYVYMENGLSKVDHLEVNEKGGFKSKWRDGFFTEKLDLL